MSDRSAEKGVGRRGFLKLVGLAGGAWAAKEAIDWLAEQKYDLSRPENFRELARQAEIYPGWRLYFRGRVVLNEGTTIHDRAALSRDSRPKEGELITTYTSETTQLGRLESGEKITIINPLILAKEADDYSSPDRVINLEGVDGRSLAVDLNRSWLVLRTDRAAAVPEKIIKSPLNKGVGFVRLDQISQIDFFPEANPEKTFYPAAENFAFAQVFVFDGQSWRSEIAGPKDRQTPWMGPAKTANGVIEVGQTARD